MEKKKKSFTITEVGAESPMIGTIIDVDPKNLRKFHESFSAAIQEHFDADYYNNDNLPDMFSDYASSKELTVILEDSEHLVEITETWIY